MIREAYPVYRKRRLGATIILLAIAAALLVVGVYVAVAAYDRKTGPSFAQYGFSIFPWSGMLLFLTFGILSIPISRRRLEAELAMANDPEPVQYWKANWEQRVLAPLRKKQAKEARKSGDPVPDEKAEEGKGSRNGWVTIAGSDWHLRPDVLAHCTKGAHSALRDFDPWHGLRLRSFANVPRYDALMARVLGVFIGIPIALLVLIVLGIPLAIASECSKASDTAQIVGFVVIGVISLIAGQTMGFVSIRPLEVAPSGQGADRATGATSAGNGEPAQQPADARPVKPNPGIPYRCPGCGAGLRVKPESAGKRVKCPKCGVVGTVAAAARRQT